MARAPGPPEETSATGRRRIPEFAEPVGNQVYLVSSEKGNSTPRNLKGWGVWVFGLPPLTPEKAFALLQRKGIKWRLAHFFGAEHRNTGASLECKSWGFLGHRV